MLSELKNGAKVIGLKQSQRALSDDTAKIAFVAEDAEKRITDEFTRLCREKNIPVHMVETMKELGDACEIEVGAAVAVLLV